MSGVEQSVSVSAVVIARDEASRIAACVRALVAAAAEVVVADTGSSDATPALAEQAGARVIRRLWDDDFSAARNFAAGQAAHDWILQVDADETLMNPDAARPAARFY
jgi:glycosyltransferase involved in cell wall biosynthesis